MRAVPVVVCFVLLAWAPAAIAQDVSSAGCTMGAATDPDDRIFCEAMDSATFVQFAHLESGLAALETMAPELIDVRVIGESVEGRPLYFVEITNELSAVARQDKLQVGYSASIHANEAAGREGMVRVMEDLVRGIGPHGAELQPLLDNLIVNIWFPNPDSWVTGDYFDADSISAVHECSRGPVPLIGGPPVGYCSGFDRENAAGVDLNREFPNPGWIDAPHTPMSEPEARAVVSELRYSGNHSNFVAAADLHGMVDSPNMIRSIIPNQDYDFRRMVLIVDQLRTTQERVEADPAFAEWSNMDAFLDSVDDLPPIQEVCADPMIFSPRCYGTDVADGHAEQPYLWGARWDQIGYTDSGFTSDYLTLSPRSPTGGMGAVGTIVEFAYSHFIPDNRYVAKLTDMHVAGVRQIVRTQMEHSLRLETPMLVATGTVGFLDDPTRVKSSLDDNVYVANPPRSFDLDDADARFDFNQVPYDVSNIQFWHDLSSFADRPFVAVPPGALEEHLPALQHFAISNQAIDSLTDADVAYVREWVHQGGRLLLTDRALQFMDRSGITRGAVASQCVYIGHSDLQSVGHPLLGGVDWNARVTAEASATGFEARSGQDRNFPQWGIRGEDWLDVGGEIVGTTAGKPGTSDACEDETTERLVTLGRKPVGRGRIDILGAALPLPTQEFDHRYGLADYSVSALTYWIIVNSFEGEIAWVPIEAPYVPSYDFDPLASTRAADADEARGSPAIAVAPLVVLLGALAAGWRRRR